MKIGVLICFIFLFGCGPKIDENGFFIEGNNIGIHKETKTKYDKDGFNINGWDKNGYNKITKDKFNIDGWNIDGFNAENIHRDTGTKYDKDGWNVDGFNEKGINKKTGFNFDSFGYPMEPSYFDYHINSNELLSKPYRINYGNYYGSNNKDYLKTFDDKFEGITYIGRSYNYDLYLATLNASIAQSRCYIATKTKKSSDFDKAVDAVEELVKIIKDKFYIDIVTNYSPKNIVDAYFLFTFFSNEKQYSPSKVELFVNNEIITIDGYIFNSYQVDQKYGLGMSTETVPLYLNQIKIPMNENFFNLFATMERNKQIEVRVVTDKDYRFKWTNVIEKNKGLPTGLGRYYKMKNSSKNSERAIRIL